MNHPDELMIPEFDELDRLTGLEASMEAQLDALEADVAGIEAAALDLSSVFGISVQSLSLEQQMDLEFAGNWLRGQVAKYLRRLLALLRKYGPRLAGCVPAVAIAVVLAKAGNWFAALTAAYDAYDCISKALR